MQEAISFNTDTLITGLSQQQLFIATFSHQSNIDKV